MRIEYYQKEGRIGIRYSLVSMVLSNELSMDLLHEIEKLFALEPEQELRDIGFVPEEIQAQGKQTILAFGRDLCVKDFSDLRNRAKRKVQKSSNRVAMVDLEIQIVHSTGVALMGRVRKHPDKGILVTLEIPFKLQEGEQIHYPTSFAEAMSGERIFNEDGSLSNGAKKHSRQAIIKLYEDEILRQRYGGVLKLMEELNEAGRG